MWCTVVRCRTGPTVPAEAGGVQQGSEAVDAEQTSRGCSPLSSCLVCLLFPPSKTAPGPQEAVEGSGDGLQVKFSSVPESHRCQEDSAGLRACRIGVGRLLSSSLQNHDDSSLHWKCRRQGTEKVTCSQKSPRDAATVSKFLLPGADGSSLSSEQCSSHVPGLQSRPASALLGICIPREASA